MYVPNMVNQILHFSGTPNTRFRQWKLSVTEWRRYGEKERERVCVRAHVRILEEAENSQMSGNKLDSRKISARILEAAD